MKIFVRPAREDLLVRDPVSRQHLPVKGKLVEHSSYWIRRIQSGDVLEGAPKVKSQRKRTVVKEARAELNVPVVDEPMNVEGMNDGN